MGQGPVHEDDGFYAALPAFDRFEDVAEANVYARVPGTWLVLITDVRGSTRAIDAGRYKDVNAMGVSTIIAVVNQIPDLAFPYVFGGDGATLLIPPSRREAAVHASRNAISLARDAFDLDLRAGLVPVAELTAAGAAVRVAKFRVSPHVTMAMFEGGGLSLAERRVKDPELGQIYALAAAEVSDRSIFKGFECRWRPIKTRKDRMVSLLVAATTADKDEQRCVYRRVLAGIAAAAHLGMDGMRPLEESGLSISGTPGNLRVEASVRSCQPRGWRFWWFTAKASLLVGVGALLMRHGIRLGGFDGATYRRDLVANTDFRKFDDMLRMVLDVSDPELQGIMKYLEAERSKGDVVYGVHASDSALLTCFIQDFAGHHIHFLDGSDGGYALAARQLKEQLRARKGLAPHQG